MNRGNREAILAARSAFNDAIARRDTGAIGALLTPDYSVITPRSLQRNGRELSIKTWSEVFARDVDVVHISTPDDIQINETWGMAEEHGTWVATIWTSDGLLELTGVYAAKWHMTSDGWMLRAEIFTPMTVIEKKKADISARHGHA